MGVKGLLQFIKERTQKAVIPSRIGRFSGKSLALDISVFLYRFAPSLKERWLEGFEALISSLSGINIYYVFDGKPCLENNKTMELRRERAENAKIYCRELKKEINDYERDNKEIGEHLVKFVDENAELYIKLAKERLNVYVITDKDKEKLMLFLSEKDTIFL